LKEQSNNLNIGKSINAKPLLKSNKRETYKPKNEINQLKSTKMNLFIKKTTFLFALFLVFFPRLQGQENPIANPKAIVTSGNMRFTVLTPEMIRIEWSDTKEFEDRASFIAVNRNLPVPNYTTQTTDGYLFIKTEKVELKYKINSNPITNPASSTNLKITFNLNGQPTIWYPGKPDPLNLKGTMRTLDQVNGDNARGSMEDGLLSRSGWVVIDESKPNGDTSKSLLFENQGGNVDWVAQRKPENKIDWYFMAYGHDYKKALHDFTQIGGKIPMPPLYAFGYWYSKYEKYSEQDFKNIVNDIKKNDIPIDIMVVDMDWHKEGWTGWSWNNDLFPDPQGFLKWLNQNKLKVTLNLHPADGVAPYEDNFTTLANDLELPANQTIKWNIENETFYKYFFKDILRPHENNGVDFWWLDWQQWLLTPGVEGLGNTFWLNHVFYNDMKINRPDRRPMIFHRWGGLGNHRYPIGFSGDSWANFSTLAFEIYFNATASNVAYGYWSHDLGGHIQPGDNNPELYLRWIQFGVFSPITRTHATNAPHIERRIWKYPNFGQMRDALKLRYALIPYIYTFSRQAYDNGVALCRPLYYDYPESNEAYKQETTYMFGDDILVSPIVTASNNKIGTSEKQIWLPEGQWYEAETGTMLNGNKTFDRSFAQNEIPFYYKQGAIIPMYPDVKHLKNRPDTLIVKFTPGSKGLFTYYEDNGDNNKYQEEQFTTTKIEQETDNLQGRYTIHPRQGSFENMPAARRYELQILSKLPAQKVVVDGTVYGYSAQPKQGSWTYDGKQLAIVINIPSKSCGSQTNVVVDFDKKQAEANDLIAGKVGQMARMIQCHESLKPKIGSQMPQLFTNLAGTSDKITASPNNTLALLNDFEQKLEEAFDLLQQLTNTPSIEISDWRDFILHNKSAYDHTNYGGTDTTKTAGYNTDGTKLWITGSAIPGNTAVLLEDPSQTPGYFRYFGELKAGEFRIMNTPTIQSNTVFYTPSSEVVNAVGSSSIFASHNSSLQGWNVTIPDNNYKLKINAVGKSLQGEIFRTRQELFIVGGATQVGWNAGQAIRLENDKENPNLFVFTGMLKEATSGDDRNMFKFLGQNDWGPVSFHAKTQNASILEAKYLYENLPGDHKWAIDSQKPGIYVIKVDLLKETIQAKYTDSYLYAVYINGVEWKNLNEAYPLNCDNQNTPLKIEIVPLAGNSVDIGTTVDFKALNPGLNTLNFTIISSDGAKKQTYKLKVTKPFDLSDLVTQTKNKTLTVNNNPDENGGYKFVNFEWYEDGRLIGDNKPYYSAGKLKQDALYMVKLTDANGDKFQTCPSKLEFKNSSQLIVYPSFLKVGETIHVMTTMPPQQSSEKPKLNVVNLNGTIVYHQSFEGSTTSFAMSAPGIYVVQLITETNISSAKLLIGR